MQISIHDILSLVSKHSSSEQVFIFDLDSTIYDLTRINFENYILIITGLSLVCAFILFMTISPLYTNLNEEKEVPERVTG